MNDKPASIPFNRPAFLGNELEYIRQAVSALHASGDGGFTKKCSAEIEQTVGAHRCLLTGSCTHALEMCALLLDFQQGDEVIVPSFTFVSTVNAFVMRGAKPVFADIRPDTLNIDAGQIESLISPRTKAIVVVHYGGIGCEMDQVMDISDRHGIPVIEDNAHGFLGQYKEKYLGTFGALATLSFHETKNLSCGEGGALLVNDPQYIERAEIIRDKGTDRKRFFRGAVDKYTWVDLGSSYVLSDLLAAVLCAQLEVADTIHARRKAIWNFYDQEFRQWAPSVDVQLPYTPVDCRSSYHVYFLILKSTEQRDALIDHLKSQSIISVFHYTPLHLSKMGRQHAAGGPDCPVTSRVSETLLRLPIYNDLSRSDQQRVVDEVKRFFTDWEMRR